MISLALPLLAESILLQLYTTASTFLLKGYAQWAVTAVSISDAVLNIAIMLFTMAIKGSVILISFCLGRQDSRGAARICGTAWFAVLGVSVLTGSILAIWADTWISLMNLTGPVAAYSANYLRIRAVFLPITALMSLFNNLLICHGHAKHSMLSGLLGNISNILFCYIALYSNILLPVSGVAAAAFCCVLSQLFSLLLAFFLFKRNNCPLQMRFDAYTTARIFTLGIPSGMCSLSFAMSQTLTTGFAASLGETVVNAKVYIGNIVLYTSRISLAIGNATGVLTGRFRGMGQTTRIQKLFTQNIRIGMLCNLGLSCAVFLFHRQLIGLFTDDATILAVALPVILTDILIEASRGVNHVAENALNANGDVRATFIISVISTWTFSVLLAYILGIVCNLGLVGLWIGFALDEVFKATAYALRWKKGKWKNTILLTNKEDTYATGNTVK